MKIYLVTEIELNGLVEKIELLTLRAESHNPEGKFPIDRLRRSIHYHVTEWIQEIKKKPSHDPQREAQRA